MTAANQNQVEEQKAPAEATGETARVVAVCLSEKKGVQKMAVSQVQTRVDHGIVGDAHAGNWHRQISLLAQESVEPLKTLLPDLAPGAFAENILTRGLTLHTLPVGTRLRVGEAKLEVTQIGKECHAGCAIRRLTGDCVMPREGIFAKVLEPGIIRPGDPIQVLP